MLLLIHAISHLLVDAVCAATLFGPLGQEPGLSSLISLYSLLAFSTQCLVGLLADRFRHLRPAAAAGMLCIALGFFLPLSALPRVILIGLGNSVFHVAAGSLTLQNSGFRAAPLGCFVAPGAIGVSLGSIFPLLGPVLALLLLAAAVISVLPMAAQRDSNSLPVTPTQPAGISHPSAVILVLTAAVAIRAIGGVAVRFPWQTGPLLTMLTAFFVFGGKLAGGFLCDRIGPRRSAWASVPAAAVLISFCSTWMLPALLGQFALNLTMPITLWLLYRAIPDAPGFAFGMAASALIPGTMAGKYLALSGPTRWYFLLLCFLFGLWAILFSFPSAKALGHSSVGSTPFRRNDR